MGSSYGTLAIAAAIAILFFFASPGIIWTWSILGEKNLVADNSNTSFKANKTVVACHAILFGVAMAFGYPIIQKATANI